MGVTIIREEFFSSTDVETEHECLKTGHLSPFDDVVGHALKEICEGMWTFFRQCRKKVLVQQANMTFLGSTNSGQKRFLPCLKPQIMAVLRCQ